MWSTDIDQTLMSAESQLSALFPPGPSYVRGRGTHWWGCVCRCVSECVCVQVCECVCSCVCVYAGV